MNRKFQRWCVSRQHFVNQTALWRVKRTSFFWHYLCTLYWRRTKPRRIYIQHKITDCREAFGHLRTAAKRSAHEPPAAWCEPPSLRASCPFLSSPNDASLGRTRATRNARCFGASLSANKTFKRQNFWEALIINEILEFSKKLQFSQRYDQWYIHILSSF